MSSNWWEQPYKGAPMISLPGFPRPLYPPDSKSQGRTPSVNGPDVQAYKRVVWRLGRWPGPASGFDNAFSNNFSHGKSGNAGDSGIAGMQRQAKIDDTGWVGEKTFNFMRSVLIPEGIKGGPGKAGEYAMDAYAQSLLVNAWDQFGGKEPPPTPTTALRVKALNKAITQLGVKESPPNSNITPYTQWYGMTGPWCAMFVTWAYEQSGDSPSFVKGKNYAYVPYIVNDARAKRNGLSVVSSPTPGDLVCFDWHYDGIFDHVGIFERWSTTTQFSSIEGNTANGNDSDGGEVMRRTRSTTSAVCVFARVAEP